MGKQYKISVIIPTYNVENTIARCVDSVLNQTEKEVEIICVDDGSTDLTLEVLDTYAQKHGSIIIKKQKHAGAGAARNAGIELSNGEYISFLDADDVYYQKDALEKMLDSCAMNDVDVCGSFLANIINERIEDVDVFPNVEFENGIGKMVSFEDFQNDFYYQCFLFRKKIFEDKTFRFPTYARYQDPPLFLKIMTKQKFFWVEPVHLYLYSYDEHNRKHVRNVEDILMGICDNLKISVENNYHDLYKRLLERLNNYYYDAVLENVSERTLEILLQINSIISKSEWNDEFILMRHIVERIQKYKIKCDSNYVLEKILDICKGKYNKEYAEEIKEEKIIIYGVGFFGEKLIDCLLDLGVRNLHLVDNNKSGKNYKSFTISSPNRMIDDGLLIVALVRPEEVMVEYSERKAMTIFHFLEKLSGE